MQLWNHAIARILERMEDIRKRVGDNYPHWCDYETGKWTTTVDGDWTGGFWAGVDLVGGRETRGQRLRAPGAGVEQGPEKSVSLGIGVQAISFFFWCVLRSGLFQDKEATDFAIVGARSLAAMYNPTLKLIPLGAQAEEGDNVGNIESSIDSLHATPFLLWAAQASGDEKMRQIGRQHAA